jgi:hypothetical protein
MFFISGFDRYPSAINIGDNKKLRPEEHKSYSDLSLLVKCHSAISCSVEAECTYVHDDMINNYVSLTASVCACPFHLYHAASAMFCNIIKPTTESRVLSDDV